MDLDAFTFILVVVLVFRVIIEIEHIKWFIED